MEPLDFFDCSCSFGMRGIINPGSFYKLEDLIKNMDLYGIGRALVYHSMAREYNSKIGNVMLLNEIKNYSNLLPVWVVMPHHTDEFPSPKELIKNMRENNVRAVRMFPAVSDHGYSLSEWNCGELFNILEKHNIPLFIGMEQTSWEEMHTLCSNHPQLKVVVTGVTYRISRNLYPFMKIHKNLYIETMGYKVYNGIEDLCSKFGAHRLIFGSSMPVSSGASAVTMINYAKISDEEKYMIARENLENLLGGVQF